MINYKLLLAVVFLCLGMTANGFSITITGPVAGGSDYAGTNPGEIDTLLDWTTIDDLGKANWKTETAWVNSIIAPDTATFDIKEEDVTLYSTDTSGVYAVYLPPPGSEYFLVKNSTFFALFQNLAEIDWGLFDTTEFDNTLLSGMNIGDFTVSHVTRFDGSGGGGGSFVPEPATLLLFGFGLLGLAGLGRKKRI